MNKTELIAVAAEKAGLSKKDTEKALGAILESVEEALVAGDKVQLVGFGVFDVKSREARTATPRPKRSSRFPLPRARSSRPARR
mgnify:CR=1 FL=1